MHFRKGQIKECILSRVRVSDCRGREQVIVSIPHDPIVTAPHDTQQLSKGRPLHLLLSEMRLTLQPALLILNMKVYSNSLQHQEIQVSIASSSNVTLDARVLLGGQVCVLFCHPYGPLGGNMDNVVVYSLFQLFASCGYMTCRFDFRGAGRSSGRTSLQGQGEIDDVRSVYKYLKRRSDWAPKYFILVGYSYGAIAAGAAASDLGSDLIGFIAISYPAGVSWALTLWNGKKYADALKSMAQVPKLLLIGDKDNFTSLSTFESFAEGVPEPKTVLVVKDVDHFWAGWEDTLIGHVRQWAFKHLDLSRYASPVRAAGSTGSVGSTGSTSSIGIKGHASPDKKSQLSTSSLDLKTTASLDPPAPKPRGKHAKATSESLPSSSSTFDKPDKQDLKRWSLCQDTIDAIDSLLLDDLVASDTTLTSSEALSQPIMRGKSPIRRPPPPVPPLAVHSLTGTSVQSPKEALLARRPSRPPPPIPGTLLPSVTDSK